MTEKEYAAYFTPEFRAYVQSEEYKERCDEYERRLDSGALTVEEAVAILRIPLGVFQWNFARQMAEARERFHNAMKPHSETTDVTVN